METLTPSSITSDAVARASEQEIVALWHRLNKQDVADPDLERTVRAIVTYRAQQLVEETNNGAYRLFTGCGIPVEETRHRKMMNKMWVVNGILFFILVLLMVGSMVALLMRATGKQ